MEKKYCPYCMTKLSEEGGRCPNCQLTDGSYQPKPFHIPPGAILRDRYLVGKVIGEGGFGITYIGCDLILDRKVAIKEYYPRERVNRVASNSLNVEAYFGEQGRSYEAGKNKFLNEARVMAMLTKEPAIVRVQDFFEDNNTAYIVMEYIEGTTLSELVTQKGGKISADELLPIVEPLFNALQTMHEMEFVHRDISPENIMIERGQVRLLDFGCAREAVSKSETLSIMLKPGYAPIEQYQQYGQGPWTDVYALCATLYYCLTGTKPPLSVERMIDDKLVRPKKLGVDLTEQQENALIAGLKVVPGRRTQTVKELHANLYGSEPVTETSSLTVAGDDIESNKNRADGTIDKNTSKTTAIDYDSAEKLTGSLVISSKMKRRKDDNNVSATKFTVALSGEEVDLNGTYGDVDFVNGSAEIEISEGRSTVLSGIPAGTSYTIESGEIDGYTANISKTEGVIDSGSSKNVRFDYKPAKTIGAADGQPEVDSNESDKQLSSVWRPIIAIAGIVLVISMLVALVLVPKLRNNDTEPASKNDTSVTANKPKKTTAPESTEDVPSNGIDLTDCGGISANISVVSLTGQGTVYEEGLWGSDIVFDDIEDCDAKSVVTKGSTDNYTHMPYVYLEATIGAALGGDEDPRYSEEWTYYSFNDVSRFTDDENYYLEAQFSYRSITFKAYGYDDIVLRKQSITAQLIKCDDPGNDFWYPTEDGMRGSCPRIDLTRMLYDKLQLSRISIQEFAEYYFPAVYAIEVDGLKLDSLVAYPKDSSYEPDQQPEQPVDIKDTAWFGLGLVIDNYLVDNGTFNIENGFTLNVPPDDPTRIYCVTKENTHNYVTFPTMLLKPFMAIDESFLKSGVKYRAYASFSYDSITFKAEGYDDIVIGGRSSTAWFDLEEGTLWTTEKTVYGINPEIQQRFTVEEFVESYYPAVYEISMEGLTLDSLVAYPKDSSYESDQQPEPVEVSADDLAVYEITKRADLFVVLDVESPETNYWYHKDDWTCSLNVDHTIDGGDYKSPSQFTQFADQVVDRSTRPSIWLNTGVQNHSIYQNNGNYGIDVTFTYSDIVFKADGYDDVIIPGKTVSVRYDTPYVEDSSIWLPKNNDHLIYLSDDLFSELEKQGVGVEEFIESYCYALTEISYTVTLDEMVGYCKE